MTKNKAQNINHHQNKHKLSRSNDASGSTLRPALPYTTPVPVIKWAGGKRNLINKYRDFIPPDFNKYYEPFFGGGALFFYLFSRGLITNAKISDVNEDLINMYKVIRDNVHELIDELQNGTYVNEKEVYYQIRSLEPTDPIERAARLLYLNHTCFNGLYRVNKQGKFNVPYGRYPKTVKIFSHDNLKAVSHSLQNVEITVEDFETAVKSAKETDFVYFDPPYAPLSMTSDFTSYTPNGFKYHEQKRLARVFDDLSKKHVYVMESNSSAPLIFELYRSYRIELIQAKRYINSNPQGRGGVNETIIMNYNANFHPLLQSSREY